MADKAKQEEALPEEKSEPTAATNGTAPGIDEQEDVEKEVADVAATYHRAKKELGEAVGKLREEMARLDVEKARQKARTFVAENPTLSIALALGAGIVVGRLVSSAFKPDPPPPVIEPTPRSRREVATRARQFADDVSDVVSEGASVVGHDIVRRAHELGEDVSRRARDLGRDVTRRAADTISSVADRAEAFDQKSSEQADHVVSALEEAAEEIALAVQDRGGHGLGIGESLFQAAKTIAVALVARKISDLFRRGS